MAEFEGDLNLNVETSEIEINGKFELNEEELNRVSGGTRSVSFLFLVLSAILMHVPVLQAKQ